MHLGKGNRPRCWRDGRTALRLPVTREAAGFVAPEAAGNFSLRFQLRDGRAGGRLVGEALVLSEADDPNRQYRQG